MRPSVPTVIMKQHLATVSSFDLANCPDDSFSPGASIFLNFDVFSGCCELMFPNAYQKVYQATNVLIDTRLASLVYNLNYFKK